MNVFTGLTTRFYEIAKRYPSVKRIAYMGWRLLMWLRGLQRGSAVVAPIRHVSTEEWIAHSDHSGSCDEVYPPSRVTVTPPNTIEDDLHWCFDLYRALDQKAMSVATVPEGRVLLSMKGTQHYRVAVITAENAVLTDFLSDIRRSADQASPQEQAAPRTQTSSHNRANAALRPASLGDLKVPSNPGEADRPHEFDNPRAWPTHHKPGFQPPVHVEVDPGRSNPRSTACAKRFTPRDEHSISNAILESAFSDRTVDEHTADVPARKVGTVTPAPELLPPVKKLAGRAAVLTAPMGGGYFHWMLQVLPRLHLMKQAGVDLRSVDHFIVNQSISRFQKETLTALDIPEGKIIQSQWFPHLQADELIVTSIPDVPRAWACSFLRDVFLPGHAPPEGFPGNSTTSPPSEAQSPSTERIYISRSQCSHRRVTNETEVTAFLRRRGFRVVHLESLSVSETAALMASAEIVIGPHGAGLTNLAFCKPGAIAIELFASRGVIPLFWILTHHAQMQYHYLIGEGPRLPPHPTFNAMKREDMTISIDSLSRLFQTLGIE